jgi:peptidoglycan hydrolase CwlO-like protein
MKPCVAFVLFATFNVAAEAAKDQGNPVTRIVTLLNGLKAKLEQDLDAETDLFETYKCWYKSTTETKTASNEAAKSRIESQKQYIKDVDAGLHTFTTERTDLEKQHEELTADLSQAKTIRENEKKDFEAAEIEMKAAIAALKEATGTIEDATKGSLAQTRSYMGMLSTRHSIQKAMSLGRGLLNTADVKYLDNLLNDDVPKADWKKLNRKATFKMKYKKRSGGILDTLGGLQKTFEGNLKDAQQKETDSQAAYDKLKASKTDMLNTAEKALNDMSLENGARGVSKQEAQDEVDALEAQVAADTKFINEAKDAFKIKDQEWAGRKDLRSKEVLAMSQAIAVLASDDAKDLMKDSFKSQGYNMLIQEAAHTSLLLSEPQRRTKCAARLVSSLAAKSGDTMLLQLARLAGKNARIDAVVKKVDELIQKKKDDENVDLEKKQECEKDLSEAAANARKAALDMDTATEAITRASAKVAELKTQIKEQEDEKKKAQGQIKDLETQRERENEDFKADKLADEKAVSLIESAIGIIKDWKNAKKSALISQHKMTMVAGALHQVVKPPALIQMHSSSRAAPEFVVAAGTAPPPPPATWDTSAEYGGAGGEQAGVVGIMEMVKEDVEKDISGAVAEEEEAVKDFDKEKADLEGEIKAIDEDISAYNKDKATNEQTGIDKTTERGNSKKELDGHIELYNSYKPGCDFLLVNFDTRTKARQIELDGLRKAKAILQGGDFGGSFLQVEC